MTKTVLGIDVSKNTIDTSTMDKVARKLPVLREVKDGDLKLLPGKIAGVFDVRSQQWIHLQHIEKPSENDKVSARTMLQYIEKKQHGTGRSGVFWL